MSIMERGHPLSSPGTMMRNLRTIQVIYLVVLLFAVHLCGHILRTLVLDIPEEQLWYQFSGTVGDNWAFLLSATYPLFWLATVRHVWGLGWAWLRGIQLAITVALLVLVSYLFYARWMADPFA